VGDLKTIKGNTDSGFVAPMAAGVLAAIEQDREGIEECRKTYGRRLQLLISLLTKHGMKLAVKPSAGFFTLWKVPMQAFGKKITDAQRFNFIMIERTGVVGVHFHPYIRYAVCEDIEAMADDLEVAFKAAKVAYE
jgi:aspartate/methionine/tyrosine aminotransferase